MATSDTELIEEVRTLTGYDALLIPDPEMQTLLQVAKNDIEGLASTPFDTIYDDKVVERATFWTTVMFTKVHMGELDAPNFTIGALKVDALPRRDIARVWYRQLDQYIARLSAGRATGITSVRRANREYNDER